jgi:hypothetical protein
VRSRVRDGELRKIVAGLRLVVHLFERAARAPRPAPATQSRAPRSGCARCCTRSSGRARSAGRALN